MTRRHKITIVSKEPTSEADARRGLLAYLTLVVDGFLVLDGVALRRTLGGRLRLSFPRKKDRQGRHHPLVRPVDGAARAEIESQVWDALDVPEDCR